MLNLSFGTAKIPFHTNHKDSKNNGQNVIILKQKPLHVQKNYDNWIAQCSVTVSQFQIVYRILFSFQQQFPQKCFNLPGWLLNSTHFILYHHVYCSCNMLTCSLLMLIYSRTYAKAAQFILAERERELMRFVLSPPWFCQTIALCKNVQLECQAPKNCNTFLTLSSLSLHIALSYFTYIRYVQKTRHTTFEPIHFQFSYVERHAQTTCKIRI